MTREDFGEALLRFGPDLERWPGDLAQSAKGLVGDDPVAAKMLKDFAAFERTVAEAVEPPPFGAAEIGSVLTALDRSEETWSPARRFWLAGAGASAISFVAGFVLMLAVIEAQGGAVPASIIGLAFGQADLGGLL
jgi:hypothetical protein